MSISKIFEKDIDVKLLSEDNFTANISENWSIGQTANGGYSMALIAKACSKALSHKDPLVLSANYIDRVEFGPADIQITKIASTKKHLYCACITQTKWNIKNILYCNFYRFF